MPVKRVRNPGELSEELVAARPSGCCHCHHSYALYEKIFPELKEAMTPVLRQALEERLSPSHSHEDVFPELSEQ